MDKAAELRASSHGVTLQVKYEGRYPTGENGQRLPSYHVAAGCNITGTTAQRRAAMDDLAKFQTPAPIRNIEGWIAELSVLTAGRGADGITAELMVTAYASRLATYPADVAKYALLSKTWKWFPSWHELEQVCEAKAGPRRHMVAAMSQPAPDPEPTRRAPTQAERARMQALIDETFPAVSQDWRDAAVSEALNGDCIKEEKS